MQSAGRWRHLRIGWRKSSTFSPPKHGLGDSPAQEQRENVCLSHAGDSGHSSGEWKGFKTGPVFVSIVKCVFSEVSRILMTRFWPLYSLVWVCSPSVKCLVKINPLIFVETVTVCNFNMNIFCRFFSPAYNN